MAGSGEGVSAFASRADHSRRYRLSDVRAEHLLQRLDASAELVDALGETEQLLELAAPPGRAPARVRLRFTVGRNFGELEIESGETSATGAPVYAAGPIERILTGIGFREIGRTMTVARRYRLGQAHVRVAHVAPVGWFCEIVPTDGIDVGMVVAGIGDALEGAVPETPTRSVPETDERRSSDRRGTERRRSRLNFQVERRTPGERRVGDRRFGYAS